jgi:hypothetical protein
MDVFVVCGTIRTKGKARTIRKGSTDKVQREQKKKKKKKIPPGAWMFVVSVVCVVR